MQPAIDVAILWLLFAGTHIGLTTRRVRAALVARLGQFGFTTLFSGVAAVSFTLFFHHYATVRFDGAAGLGLGAYPPLRWLAIAMVTTGVVLMTGSLWRFPASTLAMLDPRPFQPRGLERITRHPFFVGAALFGLAHVMLATHLVGTVAFGGLAILTIAGLMHQDRKLLANIGAPYGEYLHATSIVPFAAVLGGRQRIVMNELPWAGLAVGLALAFVLRSVHASIMSAGGAWVIGSVLGGAGVAYVQMLARRRRHRASRAGLAHPAQR